MYSILLKINPSADKMVYYLNADGTVYAVNDLEVLGAKVAELLNKYTLGQIIPIKNCTVANNITITEAVSE